MIAFEFGVPFRAGPHQAGRDGRDVNAIARQLGPQRIGQSDERELARAVGSEMRHRHSAADGSDVDDASSAAAAQMRKRLHDQIERRPKMQIHRALEILALHVLERADLNNAGVVDHDVEAAEMLDDLLDRAPICSRSSKSHEIVRTSPPCRHELVARPRQLVGIASEQRDPRALRAKLAREDQAKSSRSAGDQDDFAGKRKGSASRARDQATGESKPAEGENEGALHRM